jgi:ribosomal protein S27E
MSERPRFNIGDAVWHATWDSVTERVPCPDCGGTKTLRVILFDATEFVIPCVTCKRGLDPSRGFLEVHKRTHRAMLCTITAMEQSEEGMGYTFHDARGRWSCSEDGLFQTHADAAARAEIMAAEADAEERKALLTKAKPARDWAWHVKYHRGELKRAEEQAELHAAKLGIARAKAKKP